MRRWQADWTYSRAGIRLRVVQGKKSPDDLRMDVFVGRWVAVPMWLVFLLTDFFCENEDVLYPPPRYAGAAKFMRYIAGAPRVGWDVADEQLEAEKQRKRDAA
jgi:hypothetical protein